MTPTVGQWTGSAAAAKLCEKACALAGSYLEAQGEEKAYRQVAKKCEDLAAAQFNVADEDLAMSQHLDGPSTLQTVITWKRDLPHLRRNGKSAMKPILTTLDDALGVLVSLRVRADS